MDNNNEHIEQQEQRVLDTSTKEIAIEILKHMKEGNIQACPNGMDKETVDTLKQFSKTLSAENLVNLDDILGFMGRCKKTTKSIAFAILLIGFLLVFFAGVSEYFAKYFK